MWPLPLLCLEAVDSPRKEKTGPRTSTLQVVFVPLTTTHTGGVLVVYGKQPTTWLLEELISKVCKSAGGAVPYPFQTGQTCFLCSLYQSLGLATYLSPGGRIVFSQDHRHCEIACIDAVPRDGSCSRSDELHFLIADEQSFDEARQFVRGQIQQADLQCLDTEDCYRDGRYGYSTNLTKTAQNYYLSHLTDGHGEV